MPATGLTSFCSFPNVDRWQPLAAGLALDGEVEDYMVRIIPGVPPVPATDRYTMDEDQLGGFTTTDPDGTATPGFVVDDGVLANDQRLDTRPLRAKLVSFSGPGELQNFNSMEHLHTCTRELLWTSDLSLQAVHCDRRSRGEIVESETLGTARSRFALLTMLRQPERLFVATQKNVSISLTQADVIARSQASPGPANEADQTLTLTVTKQCDDSIGIRIGSRWVLTYIPAPGFVGTDTFVITLTDNGVSGDRPPPENRDPRSVDRIVTVTVANRNDPPVTTLKTISNRRGRSIRCEYPPSS